MNQLALYEFPQGDPYSGPAHGDKHKSKGLGMVLGVVASVATMGAAAPMLSSTAIASQIAGGAMMAGGVLTGVGTVTGNKKLMKVGGVLSLAGGLGNTAASGLGIGQAAGSGSQAVSRFGTSFMESVNGLGVGDLYSAETIAGAKEAGASAFGTAGVEESAGALGATGETGGGILNSATNEPIKLAGEAVSAPGAGGQTIDLAKSELAGAGGAAEGPMSDFSVDTMNLSDNGMDSNMRAVQNKQVGILSRDAGVQLDTSAQVGRSRVTDTAQYAPAAGGESSFTKDALKFIRENPDATKIGADMLEKAMGAAANDDQVSALIDKYKAETNLLTTKNDIEKYKLANAGKQVAMISADDADLDAKVKQATAAGIPVAFIPAIGKNYTPVSKNFTPVVRNATYNQPTA